MILNNNTGGNHDMSLYEINVIFDSSSNILSIEKHMFEVFQDSFHTTLLVLKSPKSLYV